MLHSVIFCNFAADFKITSFMDKQESDLYQSFLQLKRMAEDTNAGKSRYEFELADGARFIIEYRIGKTTAKK